MGGKWTAGPEQSVSPIANAPGLVRPMMSPANPVSTVSRSLANMRCGAASVTTRPVRATLTFIPFSNLPDTTRTNATLSRWRGSMLACSLKTRPVNWLLVGSMVSPARKGAAPGRAPCSMNSLRKSSTPKLDCALAKNIGVSSPRITASTSSSSPSTSSSSTSSLSCSRRSSSMSSASAGSPRSYSLTFVCSPLPRCGFWYSITFPVGRWKTPQKRSPLPMGQLMG
mmetsp:Transcript_17657/g.53017  ORF Transcript_17657/g.53017 Transcript_17657/m.53017 type:complete len:226 (+) Transcript_17657:835-1512(+)